jgi:DNA-binding NarL/FixJ family response regulator
MNLETQISIAAIFFGVLSFIFAAFTYKKMRNQRELLEFVGKQSEDMEELLVKNKELLDTNAQRVAEQSRRIAWLETRVRQPKQASEEIIEEHASNEPPKLNITERRHRVISLSSRGRNVEMIASTLGMLPGEVELIINLNQATQVKK